MGVGRNYRHISITVHKYQLHIPLFARKLPTRRARRPLKLKCLYYKSFIQMTRVVTGMVYWSVTPTPECGAVRRVS